MNKLGRLGTVAVCALLLTEVLAAEGAKVKKATAQEEQQQEIAELKQEVKQLRAEQAAIKARQESACEGTCEDKETSSESKREHAVDPIVVQRLGEKSVGFMPIPGTSAYIRLFGTVKVTGVYDQHEAKNGPAYDHFMAANILRPGEGSKKGEIRLHARESSFGIETLSLLHWVNGGDIDFGTYFDMDFFGSTQTEESLFTPLSLRVKRAYIKIGNETC
ncbi:MAG: hypothetical protein LBD15_02800, partial [Holosporales bacterium]|nr:hypothetical protein [Holosporales bacterium]